MKKITKLELAMMLFAFIVCGTGYGIWRVQTSEDNLTPSTSVLKVEKENGFDVKGRVKVSVEE